MIRVEKLRDRDGNGRVISGDGPVEKRLDPEVLERPVRRRFTAKYKRRIVEEAESHSEDGGIGAMLRREGLYYPQLSLWRKQYRDGTLGSKRRGPSPSPSKELRKRNKQLERENARLRRQLEEARVIVGFQKKACEIMGISIQNPQSDESE